MKIEIENKVTEIKHIISLLKEHSNIELSKEKLRKLTEASLASDLWENREQAEKLFKEKTFLEKQISSIINLESEVTDTEDLIKIGLEENDYEIVSEAEETINKLLKLCEKKQFETLLSGEADPNDCYIEIHSGAGGTEAQDWANMLSRMYQRWAENKQFGIEILEETNGDEAGIKSVTMRFSGLNAYGWSKTESGIHRLVRISPFDSASRRHTSFASVWVYPVVDDKIDIVVEEKDLRIDTYRSSGAGGQHVNTTDSAVRITHLPSGIVVQCQNNRSQHRNKAAAMNMLKARLYEKELQKREEDAGNASSEKNEIGWGHQIRSYVLHPYHMVKDLRTNVEKGNTQSVLDGGIDLFIEAALSKKISLK
tara:strand:+ start:82 stop:1185 length:1104 start_codon:yes stop_codon:yes gene_type:complete